MLETEQNCLGRATDIDYTLHSVNSLNEIVTAGKGIASVVDETIVYTNTFCIYVNDADVVVSTLFTVQEIVQ